MSADRPNLFRAAVNTVFTVAAVRAGMNVNIPFNQLSLGQDRASFSSSSNGGVLEASQGQVHRRGKQGVQGITDSAGFSGANLGVSFEKSSNGTKGFDTTSRETARSRETAGRSTSRGGNVYSSDGDAFGYHYLGVANQSLELLEQIGFDTHDLRSDFDDLASDFGIDASNVSVTSGRLSESFVGIFQEPGSGAKFADKILSMNQADRQKLADLKAGALDKFGLGVFRENVVSSDAISMSDIKEATDKLVHITNQAIKQDWDSTTLLDKIAPYLGDLTANTNKEGASNVLQSSAVILALTRFLAEMAGKTKKKSGEFGMKGWQKAMIVVTALSIFLSTCVPVSPTQIAEGTKDPATQSAPATDQPATAQAAASPEPTSAPIDAACGISPGTKLFTEGYTVGKTVPVLSMTGFKEVFGDPEVIGEGGEAAKNILLETTQEVARKLHQVILADTGIRRVVIPEYLSTTDIQNEIDALRQSIDLESVNIPFEFVNYDSRNPGIGGSDTLLVAIHSGESGREIGLWVGSSVSGERPDGSRFVDGTLNLLVQNPEGDWFMYAIPGQRLDGHADIAIVAGCAPSIVRVSGDQVQALLNGDYDFAMLSAGDADRVWLDRTEALESGAIVEADPNQEVYDQLQAMGINIVNENGGGSGEWELLFNGLPLPGASLNEDGMHIQVSSDKEINIPVEDIVDRIRVVDGFVVIDSSSGTHLAAFGPELVSDRWGGRWVEANEVTIEDPWDVDSWTVVDTEQEYREASRLTEMLTPEFKNGSEAYYYADPSLIYYDYDAKNNQKQSESDFNTETPLGILNHDQLNRSPFRIANFIVLNPSPGEGRNLFACVAIQVFRNKNGVKQFIKFAESDTEFGRCTDKIMGGMGGADGSFEGGFSLPAYRTTEYRRGNFVWEEFRFNNNVRNGMMDARGDMCPGFKQFAHDWLANQIMPDEVVNCDGVPVDVNELVFIPIPKILFKR